MNLLKNRIASDNQIEEYLKKEFGKGFEVFIGNRNRTAIKQDDYPFLCLYLISEEYDYQITGVMKVQSEVALFFGIKNPSIEDANRQVIKIKDLLLETIENNKTLGGTVLLMQSLRLETDEGYFQPYYYARLIIKLEEIN